MRQGKVDYGIVQQIQSMKGLIEEFKQKEQEKEAYLLKLKEKDAKIKQLTKDLAVAKQEDSTKKLSEENRYLQETQSKVRKKNNHTLENRGS